MDASPALVRIADALAEAGLEAILIGNAAAALHGAPVTTVDFDFFYRVAGRSQQKLQLVADVLGGKLLQPFPEVSTLFRIETPGAEIQLDFTSAIHGASSFNSLRSRATQ